MQKESNHYSGYEIILHLLHVAFWGSRSNLKDAGSMEVNFSFGCPRNKNNYYR